MLNQILDQYYEERGWGINSGIPPKKLISLGLKGIADDIEV